MSVQVAELADEDVYGVRRGELDEAVFKIDKLMAWVERHKVRLEASGTTWTEWCDVNHITEWARKKLVREIRCGGLVSYAFIDQFLTPANMSVEDLYGWENPRATA